MKIKARSQEQARSARTAMTLSFLTEENQVLRIAQKYPSSESIFWVKEARRKSTSKKTCLANVRDGRDRLRTPDLWVSAAGSGLESSARSGRGRRCCKPSVPPQNQHVYPQQAWEYSELTPTSEMHASGELAWREGGTCEQKFSHLPNSTP